MQDDLTQTVLQVLLDEKLGKSLALHEVFTTKVGTWKVIKLGVDPDTYTIERV